MTGVISNPAGINPRAAAPWPGSKVFTTLDAQYVVGGTLAIAAGEGVVDQPLARVIQAPPPSAELWSRVSLPRTLRLVRSCRSCTSALVTGVGGLPASQLATS